MPPVPIGLQSLPIAEVDWFFTAEQEASSEQLRHKVRGLTQHALSASLSKHGRRATSNKL
jgi:hypothetical protein